MTWLVQYSGVDVTNTDHIMTILKAKNIPFVPVGIRPFTTEITGLEDADLSGPVMAYGSTKLVKLVMELGLSPGVFFDYSTFNAMAWKHFLRDKMANDALFVPIGTLRKFIDNRADTVAKEAFVRPVMDLKLFSGSVKPTGMTFTDFFDEKLNGSRAFEHTLVAMSHPLEIQGEWRCFIVNCELVTASQYRIDGELKSDPSIPDGLKIFVDSICHKWLPHDHCVMDVALVDDEFKIMEFNCINASGLYAADAEKLVDALNSLML